MLLFSSERDRCWQPYYIGGDREIKKSIDLSIFLMDLDVISKEKRGIKNNFLALA